MVLAENTGKRSTRLIFASVREGHATPVESVKSKKGADGVDGLGIVQTRQHLKHVL